MLRRIKNTVKSLFGNSCSASTSPDASVEITEDAVIDTFKSDPENPFLVSFPRTGSHWLRMLMELYFERPSLVRVFFYPEQSDYLTLHTHDLDLNVQRDRVLYLYREPVATIYSQMQYHEEDLNDSSRISYWSRLYGRHLQKWLDDESFTRQKTTLQYGRLKADTATEFSKVCDFFGVELDGKRFQEVSDRVSKQKVKSKTQHDSQVVDLREQYERRRTRFRDEQGKEVWRYVLEDRSSLATHFASAPAD
jgi:hypothetical protein